MSTDDGGSEGEEPMDTDPERIRIARDASASNVEAAAEKQRKRELKRGNFGVIVPVNNNCC